MQILNLHEKTKPAATDAMFVKVRGAKYDRVRFKTIPEMLRAYRLSDMSDERFAEAFPWISHDSSLRREYRVTAGSRHDGTLIFTQESVTTATLRLLERTTYFKPTGEWDRIEDVRYVVTGCYIARVFDENNARQPVREVVRIGLRCIH